MKKINPWLISFSCKEMTNFFIFLKLKILPTYQERNSPFTSDNKEVERLACWSVIDPCNFLSIYQMPCVAEKKTAMLNIFFFSFLFCVFYTWFVLNGSNILGDIAVELEKERKRFTFWQPFENLRSHQLFTHYYFLLPPPFHLLFFPFTQKCICI